VSKFSEILKNLDDLRPIAERDLSEIPRDGLPGVTAAKRAAQDEVERLRELYKEQLMSSSAVVFLTTDRNDPDYFEKVTKFVDLSKKEGLNVIVDGSDFYNRIAAKVDLIVSLDPRRQYMVDNAVLFAETLREECAKIGIRTGSVGFTERLILNNFDETLTFVRDTVRRVYGDIINDVFMRTSIVAQAIEARHANKMLPIVAYGLTSNEVEVLKNSFNTNLVVSLDEVKVDKKFALQQFSDLKTLFNSK
jgi:hypothetical protein